MSEWYDKAKDDVGNIVERHEDEVTEALRGWLLLHGGAGTFDLQDYGFDPSIWVHEENSLAGLSIEMEQSVEILNQISTSFHERDSGQWYHSGDCVRTVCDCGHATYTNCVQVLLALRFQAMAEKLKKASRSSKAWEKPTEAQVLQLVQAQAKPA
jgi:hypothetical protein